MLARNPVSLLSLTAWLRTKDPEERYPFCDMKGECLFSQYLSSLGFSSDPTSDFVFDTWRVLHHDFGYVAAIEPWTFGDALARAEAMEANPC
jgi:hypothetical protein